MTASLFAAPEACVARIALPVPIDRLFDYAVPASMAPEVQPGCRALVPFRDRLLTGVIVERADAAEFEGTLRSIERVLDGLPVLSETMLAMLREAADDCLCPIGIALATALPPGSAPRLVAAFALTGRGRAALASGAAPGAIRRVLERLADAPRSEAALRDTGTDASALTALLDSLVRDDLVQRVRVERAPSARVAVRRFARLAPDVDLEQAREALKRAPRQAELLDHLARGEARTDSLGPRFDGRLLRELATRGLVTIEEREVPRDVLGDAAPRDTLPELTGDQATALKPICDAVQGRRAETFLLHGVTGSGKTEVYLRAIAEALRLGRQALVLVPEITLTHQIVARLRARFGDTLAVLHSGLRPGERLEQWQRLRGGDTPIAVGARSALFAPLTDVGVIVIDEEHDGAYKNEDGLRYHARSLAARRAVREGCPLVLGSATPSLETRFAADRGDVQRLVLSRRIGGRPLPAVQIVDLARERARAPRGRKVVLSLPLRAAMAETLAAGGQTILFLNRRGFSTQVFCFDCGHAERCPHCDITLVYHAAAQRLRCHYCDHSIPPPRVCGGCGAPDTALLGLGTERLVEEVRTHFPDARVARLDRDTAARRGHTQQVLRELGAGRIDVLVGTQMVAKGHDFPGVRLVGVVAADIGLHMPDFRAAERTFQLLTQVAGRAGRDRAPGRVIVQTFVPSHYAIRPVRDHDFESFYAEELTHRAELGFPPFGRVAHVVVSAEDEEAAHQGAAGLAQSIAGAPGCEILGPAPAPLAKLRDRYRYQLLVKGDAASVHAAGRRLVEAVGALPDAIQASVDVDPVHML